MADKYQAFRTDITAVADAIRERTGGEGELQFPDEFISGIRSIAPDTDTWRPITCDGVTVDDHSSPLTIVEGPGADLSFTNNGVLTIGVDESVTDVQIGGVSIVDNYGVANITLGPALTKSNMGLTLTTANLQDPVPKNATIAQQGNMKIFIDNNGVISATNLNNLDYIRLKVVDTENLDLVNERDFLFIKS